MTAVRTSLALSALDSYAGLLLQIATTVIVARLLTPAETGIFAVAAVFAALASTFRDFGVAEYLIQETKLNNDAIRAALTVNIVVSWIMGLLLFFLAPAASHFYNESGISQVMRIQAVSFLLIPFGAVTMAWFRREMNFKPILIANLLSNIVSFIVAIALALRGFSYMSLAWASLAGVITTVATSVLMRPTTLPYLPGFKGVGRVIHFGKFASGIYIFGQAGKGAPEMIIGRGLDMASVGLFSRAYGLVEIFNRLVLKAVLPVCLPYLADSVRKKGNPLRGVTMIVSYLSVIGWTFLGFTAIVAYSAVRLMYGSQWMGAVALAQIICAAGAVELLFYTAKEALLSVGKARESNQLQMLIQGSRIGALLAAVPFGLEAICWGLLASSVCGATAASYFLNKHIDLYVSDISKALLPSALVTLISLAPIGLWTSWFPIGESNYILTALIGAAATAAMWLFALKAVGHQLWDEIVRTSAKIFRRF
jgi:O-antigen/teichoic acid export membrane protein